MLQRSKYVPFFLAEKQATYIINCKCCFVFSQRLFLMSQFRAYSLQPGAVWPTVIQAQLGPHIATVCKGTACFWPKAHYVEASHLPTPATWTHCRPLIIFLFVVFSRPRQSQGLLYNHLRHWLIHSLSHWLILCENIFTAPPCLNDWRWCFHS